MEVVGIIVSAVLAIVTGIFLFKFQQSQNRAEKKAEQRDARREKEAMLSLQMSAANGELSSAIAIAVKRGHANGEVEAAMQKYNESTKAYYTFLDEVAYSQILKS